MKVKLDKHQLKAMKHFQGPALVVAGPGSGKTTVIIKRILNLIHEHNVDPERILAIAFTNAAVDTMKDRVNKHLGGRKKPKICTLHSFGKEIITEHYDHKLIGFSQEPEPWDGRKIGKIIRDEKRSLDRQTRDIDVYIYKFEGKMTGRVYIGQSIHPYLREKEHRTRSSNKGLRDALEMDDEIFDFNPSLDKVKGKIAYRHERDWIRHYKNRSAIDLVQKMEEVARKSRDLNVDIYKLKSLKDSRAYFGYTTELNAIRENFNRDRTSPIVFDEVLYTDIPWREASIYVKKEIRKHKNWAVFNREDPVTAQYRNQLRIEIFCKHFNVSYEEVLEKPDSFKNLYEKYNNLQNVDIEKAKRKVVAGLFRPEEVKDPVFREFAKEYEKKKRESNAIDFFDMLIYSAYMLENDPDLLYEYREKYRYVFVDEFQDISPIDFRLLKLFPDNLFAVGDDDQAIYGFRGGDSKIMQNDFANWENTQKYEITRNYRSTSDIVIHSKAVIENNQGRIDKNLRSYTSDQGMITYFDLSKSNLFSSLLREFSDILSSDYQKVGILARNWLGEINDVQEMLDCPEIRRQGYEIKWEKLDNSSDEEKKRVKMLLCKGSKEIEVINIHEAKGREWDKVILLVNTMYENLPDKRNDIEEERRVFYVAVTRAKHELVIYYDGVRDRIFIDQFKKLPHSERKKRLEFYNTSLLSTFENRIINAKHQLKEVAELLSTTFASQRTRLLDASTKTLRKQYEPELESLRCEIVEVENIRKNLVASLPLQLNASRETFLKKLIAEMNHLELIVDKTTEKSNSSAELLTLSEKLHSSQKQFLDFLKIHGIRPIETVAKTFNSDLHEASQSALYSDEVPAGKIIKVFQRGYLLHNQVIQKAKVIISKGSNPWTPEKLEQTVEVYLDRLFSAFQVRYNLTDIEKSLVIQKLVEYLSGLEDNCIEEICLFANKSSKEAIQERRYTDYCAGLKKIHLCTDVFRDFWNKIWEIIRFLSAKNRNRADLILSQEYVQPVKFVTYKGYYDLTNVETYPDCIKGLDQQSSEQTIEKSDILFAFPKMNMKELKPFIKRDLSIVDQRLQPIERISEGVPVPDGNLKSYIQLVTRSVML